MASINLCSFVILLASFCDITRTETLEYSTTNPCPTNKIIQCTDDTTDCEITCTGTGMCDNAEINCHATSTKRCIINLNTNSARYSKIYTHNSATVYINSDYKGCYDCTIFAHEKMGAKVYIYGYGTYAYQSALVYGPVGQGSLLSMECSREACRDAEIYDDYTTEVYLNPYGYYGRGFMSSVVRNIFDDNTNGVDGVQLSRANYAGLDATYRAPVFLNACDERNHVFNGFKYYGKNHGDWILYANGVNAFTNAEIRAENVLPGSYDVKLMGVAETHNFYRLNLYIGTGGNLIADIRTVNGLYQSNIYAKTATSVNLHCQDGGECRYTTIECPETSNHQCNIFCDDHSGGRSDCRQMQIYTKSNTGYCNGAAVICEEVHGNGENWCLIAASATDGAVIYNGYDQTTEKCLMKEVGGDNADQTFECANFGTGNNNNGISEPTCHATLTSSGITGNNIIDSFNSVCNHFPSQDPTTVPTKDPSAGPTKRPSSSPTPQPSPQPSTGPTKRPTPLPTPQPSPGPTKGPSKNPSPQPTPYPTFPPSEHCTTNEVFHYNFVIDESGSITQQRFDNDIRPFVRDIIQRDINDVSDISMIMYDSNPNTAYRFTDTQSDRTPILNTLYGYHYNGGSTGTGSAMQEGIQQYINKGYTENNIMIVITDGVNTAGPEPCETSIAQGLTDNDITLVVIAVGITPNDLDMSCADKFFEIPTWSSSEFDAIRDELRKLTCVDCTGCRQCNLEYIDICVSSETVEILGHDNLNFDEKHIFNHDFWTGVAFGFIIQCGIVFIYFTFCYRNKKNTYGSKFVYDVPKIQNLSDSESDSENDKEEQIPFHIDE